MTENTTTTATKPATTGRETPRSLRVPDDLWNAAMAATKRHGENVSDVLRNALEEYVRADTGLPKEEVAEVTMRVRVRSGQVVGVEYDA